MFYLTNDSGRFIAVRGDVNTFLVTVWEGSVMRGVSGKKELLCGTAEEAWEHVCAQVADARSNGYSSQPIDHSPVELDAAQSIVAEFDLLSRGIYVRVKSCTAEQFNEGLAHLENVVRVLIDAGHPLAFRMVGNEFEVALNGASIRKGIASVRDWETMSPKGREIFEERGFIDSTILLPSGKGLWRFRTQESVLDVCARAFLAELNKAGAEFSVTSDSDYTLDFQRPFQRQSVQEMDWYKTFPGLLKVLEDASLLGGSGTKVSVPTNIGMSLFL